MNTGRILRSCRIILAILILIPSFSMAVSAREILSGLTEPQGSWSAEISGQFQACVPYSEDRIQHLNNLLKHLRLKIGQGKGISAVSVFLDGEETFSIAEKQESGRYRTVFSFDESTSYLSETSILQNEAFPISVPGGEDLDLVSMTGLLTKDHLALLDDAVLLAQSLSERFALYAKTVSVKTKIGDFGTAVKKTVVTIPKSETETGVLAILSEECENPALRQFLSELVFYGKQQYTFFLDEHENLIRFLYSGQTGYQDNQRKVSIDWKLNRSEEKIRDEIILKSPAVTGTDKDSLTFIREENNGETAAESFLGISFTYQRTRNKTKSATEGSFQLNTAEEKGIASMELLLGTGKKDRRKYSLDMEFSGDSFTKCEGILHCVSAQDQAEHLNLTLTFSILPDSVYEFPETNTDVNLQTIGQRRRSIVFSGLQQKMASSLVRQLLALPEEDLLFLSDELDINAWENLRNIAHPSSEGGTHP